MVTPKQIGRYRVEHELGRGGMGVVYAAYDDQLERLVAIKTLAQTGADETARKRLRREARAAARIQHPNVCHLYEIDEDNGELFLAMELLEGESLADRLRRGPLPIPEAIEISLQLLSALQVLHAAGLVHRDLKPSNIFLTPHGVKVLDFGLAQTAHSDLLLSQERTETQLTEAGMIVGTPPYMAPEQFQGKPTDSRTDLFALGAVIFEMLTGSRAFPGDSALEVYHRTLHQQPPSLGGSPAAAALDKIVRRALAKSPEDRFPGAAEMAAALGTVPAAEDTDETRAHSVARLIVLPFRVLRPDPDTDFLGIGIPDAVTNSLTGLESLVVRSSATAARFASNEPDLERIAEEADVDVVLTGTLLRAGEQIRVTTQLVEVPGGTVLWSHAPTVTMRDVFELQDRIVEHIVESLSLSLTTREHRRLKTDVPASPTAYEFFLRGNQLVLPQGSASTENLSLARDLYQRGVEEDPRYAPAWARLGRCHWLIGKGGEDTEQNTRLAEECFERALELNPELPLAHNLYALLEIDQGRAQDAMVRLVKSARTGSTQPELFWALVQVCRYLGLLEASVAAHERAEQLDRNIITSVPLTYFLLREIDRSLEYVQRQFHGVTSIANRYFQAASLAELGDTEEAIRILRELEQEKLTGLWRSVIRRERALHEGNREESLEANEWIISHSADVESLAWAGRAFAFFDARTRAFSALNRSFDRGFNVYRLLTREDPWLDSLRETPEFEDLLQRSESKYLEAVAAFREAGGEQVLGVVAKPS